MSQGAIMAFALLSAGIIAVFAQICRVGWFTPRIVRRGIIFVALTVLLALVCYTSDLFNIRTKAKAMEDYYKQTAIETGVFTSRNDVWTYSIRTILKYPVFGVVNSREPEDIPPEYRDSPEGYVSHNVFLDFGRNGGIVGMVLLAFFFFFPAAKMSLGGQWICYIPFLLTYLAMFLFWMSLSFVHYKTFWAFWMLASMAAPESPNGCKPVWRSRSRLEQRAGGGSQTSTLTFS